MELNLLSGAILKHAFAVHTELGPGLLESVYEKALCLEFSLNQIRFTRQVPIPVSYKGILIEESFRADLIVEGLILVELKSVEKLAPIHSKQVLSYLRLSSLRLGLLINFNEVHLRDGIKRLANSF